MNDELVWAIYFANMAAIEHHPRNDKPSSLYTLAIVADNMLKIHQQRWPKCQSPQDYYSPEQEHGQAPAHNTAPTEATSNYKGTSNNGKP